MSQVTTVAPRVPAMKSGVARRMASEPKVFEKRDTFVGKTDDVPMPQRDAPMLN